MDREQTIRSLEEAAARHAARRDELSAQGKAISANLEESRRSRCIESADALRAQEARDKAAAERAAGQAMLF